MDGFPGPRARERVARHARVAAPSTYVYGFVWDTVADATGPFVTDVDGNVLLDFTSHVCAASLGYNNPLVLAMGIDLLVDAAKSVCPLATGALVPGRARGQSG